MSDLKTPPNSSECERALLGSILLDSVSRSGERIVDVCMSQGISPDAFFDPRNKAVYAAMVSMIRTSRPLDAVTLLDELGKNGTLEAIGGVNFVQSLVDQVGSTANAGYYMSVVKAKALRRRMIETASAVESKCYDEASHPNPQAILGEAETAFLELGGRDSVQYPWSQAIEDSFNRIDKMFSSDGQTFEGLSTGLTHLDEKLQGLKNSEMIVIAARPSVGKTSLAMNIAECAALGRDMNNIPVKCDGGKRHPVMIFSLEMPVEALTKRMLAGRAGVNMWRLTRNLCPRKEKEMLTEQLCAAAGELKDAPIYVDDSAGLDIMELRARARRAKKAHGIELIVIDYLQLCCCREGSRQGRQIEVSMISQQIKAMAKELKVPVIVLSQLSRANEQRGDKFEKPKLSDLRDSGAIEQDADVVFLLRRPSRNAADPESQDETLAIIDVAKNRNGETGEVRVNFIREFTRFCDREPEHTGSENFQTSEPPPESEIYVQDPMI